MQGQTLGSTHDGSIHFQEVRKSHQELTKLVQTLGWTYGVIWKPTPDNRYNFINTHAVDVIYFSVLH